ncbi:MAG: acyltransferase [Deltaproteobacteria bacterium]|jgi:peptidoglycan/LPS O-acetylase OafA/YrhL|nr:acyltransferase [Deltaproteobacteria bacterium]
MTDNRLPTFHSSEFYRPDIDGLRALAVLAVVGYHAFPGGLTGGFIGVDIFFVISGFLIIGIIFRDLEKGAFSFWDFYSRRIRRIFPALSLVLCAVLIFGWLVLLPVEYKALGKHVFGGSSFTANIFYWSEAGYWDVSGKIKPLLHLWSLGIEEQFYIIIPCLLVIAWKKKIPPHLALSLLLTLSFAIYIYYYRGNRVLDFYSPFTRFWEFLCGGVLSVIVHKKYVFVKKISFLAEDLLKQAFYKKHASNGLPRLRNALAFFGFFLLVVGLTTSRAHQYFPGTMDAVFGAVFLIAAGRNAWLNRKVFANKIAVCIGLISYPLYLWHWPLLSYLAILGGEFLSFWPWLFIRLGGVSLAFILAFGTYLVEKPIRFGKRDSGREKDVKAYALVFAMIVLGCSGLLVYGQDGLPKRESIREYSALAQNLVGPTRKDEAGIQYVFPVDLLGVRYADAGSECTIAVMGDSHAACAYPGIVENNAKQGLNTFFSYYDYRRPPEYAVLQVLEFKKDIKYVFLFYRGVFNIYGTDLDMFKMYDDTLKDKFMPWLQQVIDIFNYFGIKVFVVSENPVFPIPATSYIIRPLSLLNYTKPIFFTKNEVFHHQKKYLDLLKNLERATIIYSLDTFCPDGVCSMLSHDGTPLYYDEHHLSITGSRLQANDLLFPYLLEISKNEHIVNDKIN